VPRPAGDDQHRDDHDSAAGDDGPDDDDGPHDHDGTDADHAFSDAAAADGDPCLGA
jgi:hypothetical protein